MIRVLNRGYASYYHSILDGRRYAPCYAGMNLCSDVIVFFDNLPVWFSYLFAWRLPDILSRSPEFSAIDVFKEITSLRVYDRRSKVFSRSFASGLT